MSVFGLRNLVHDCFDPEIHVCLTDDTEKEQIIKLPDLSKYEEEMFEEDIQVLDKCNPNFASKITFKDVELKKEPLMWPQLQINVVDKGGKGYVGSKRGCENTFTTISLLDYFDTEYSGILNEEDYTYSKLQLNKNQDGITFD